MSDSPSFQVILLAGDRGPLDPLAQWKNAPCKALVELEGQPLVIRVLRLLMTSERLQSLVLVGPGPEHLALCSELQQLAKDPRVSWIPPRESPSLSALAGMQELNPAVPTLLTTADQGLLSLEIVDDFLDRALRLSRTAAAGLVPHHLVCERFPEQKRTALKFQDGAFCGCNLFLFQGTEAQAVLRFWRRLESLRKRPWRMASAIGLRFLLAHLLRQHTLKEAMTALGERIGTPLGAVLLDNPDAAVDLDKKEDWILVDRILRERRENGA